MFFECPKCRQALRVSTASSAAVTVRCPTCSTSFSTAEALPLVEDWGLAAPEALSGSTDKSEADATGTTGAIGNTVAAGASNSNDQSASWTPVVAPHRAAQQSATGRANSRVASAGVLTIIIVLSVLVRVGLKAAKNFNGRGEAPAQPREVQFDEQQRAAIQRMLEDAQERRREFEGRPRAKPAPSKSSPSPEQPPSAESPPAADAPTPDR